MERRALCGNGQCLTEARTDSVGYGAHFGLGLLEAVFGRESDK